MPTLDFKGKQHIYAHHLTVPYRPLVADAGKSVVAASAAADGGAGAGGGADDNLIIHGDNLLALKALLPRYAGRVKCIYIDPPYNTGNEGWVYNDRVNSPLMREWLKQNGPVDGEDLERHDKWLCMMWPRLHLLKELLSDDGVIFVSIDDNEQHHLRMLMGEVFGEGNFIACLPTVMNLKGNNDEFGFAGTHEYTFSWAKDKSLARIGEFALDDEELESWDEDEYGYYKKGAGLKSTGGNAPRERRPNLYFPIFIGPNNEVVVTDDDDDAVQGYEKILPTTNGQEMSWRWSKNRIAANPDDVIVERTDGEVRLYKKQRPTAGDLPSRKPKTLFYKPEYSSGNGTAMVRAVFGGRVYDNPKPLKLLMDILSVSTDENSVILDSFAGSGTTAHAVLSLNQADGGNRKFILVECEDYADTITAERVRRVIGGVSGAREPALRDGLGGSFTYCTLGEPIDAEEMLTGAHLPDYAQLAAYLLHTATGVSAAPGALAAQNDAGLFYSGDGADYYLLYRPDLQWLRSNAAIFNGEQAQRIADLGRPAVVFAAGKYIGQRELSAMGITFCQIPYEMHLAGARGV